MVELDEKLIIEFLEELVVHQTVSKNKLYIFCYFLEREHFKNLN